MKKTLLLLALAAALFSCRKEEVYVDDGTYAAEHQDPSIAVDMGEAGKWAPMNIGARKPSEYGYFLAWGEIEPKTDYSWSTYKFRTSGDSWENAMFSKYNAKESCGLVDNKTTLETGPDGDDAASKKLGGKWRMPTDAEWIELFSTCSLDWTFQHGVNGGLLTAANGNSIFLPAAGYRYETNLLKVGSDGYYWSSSLYTDDPSYAWSVFFYFGTVNWRTNRRYLGFSVRPVTE